MSQLRLLAMLFALILTGCSGTKVVLLPDAGGHVGKVFVSADDKTEELHDAGKIASSSAFGLHEGQTTPEQAKANAPALFAAEPLPAASILIYFKNDAAEPVTPADSYLSRLKQDCAQRAPCHLTIIGHTDATGDNRYNMDLSLSRAEAIRQILVNAGFDAAALAVRSHGENDPLIKTAQGVAEPRNRRVEVMVH